MLKKFLSIFALTGTLALAQSGPGNPAITTGQYNTSRTAANSNEIILNPSNVNANQFGKLFSWQVDGRIHAQPLYVPGVLLSGRITNVVYVATMHNSIYAFDANNPGAAPLWQVNFGPSVTAPTSNGCPISWSTGPELGILSTPVIDQTTNTLYAVSASPSGGGYQHSIHALDITTGKEKFGGPTQIQASVPGTGYNAQNGMVTMGSTSDEVQRTALLLANGTVYAGFGSCGPDVDPWHGWVIGYSSSNLQIQQVLFNSTPNGGQGGIWQSGRGLVVDGGGKIYFTTGNASPFNGDASVTTGNSATDASNGNYPMRLIQLSATGTSIKSYPPANYSNLNNYDLDFSSSGPLLIPGTSLLLAGGKDGVIYIFDTNNFGNPLQSFQATGGSACQYSFNGCAHVRDLVFWNNMLYVWGTSDILRSFTFSNPPSPSTGRYFNPASTNSISVQQPPATLALSANGTQGGILWSTTPDSVLHAFNASNVANELWNSKQNSGRDALPSFVRFTEPTVANGRVYVATSSNQLAVYGLLSDFTVSTSVSSQSVYQGTSTSFTVNTNALAGFNGAISFSISGLPAGATASFNPPSTNGSGSTTVTINTTASTPTGTANLIISANGGGETRTASVALFVTTPDNTPPAATCCTYTTSGSSYVMHFTAQDTGSGLKSIIPVELVNATANVPQFTAGTTQVVNFTATESGWSSYVKFQVTDVAGNITYIDPAIFDLARSGGSPVPFAIKNIAVGEGVITIQNGVNGTPGLKNLRIQVNTGIIPGHIEVAGLKDGEVRVVNITSLLPTTGDATVQITPLGKPGGSATFIFGPHEILPQ